MTIKHEGKPVHVSFEIVNITPMNEFISDCEIKIFYTGKNRNGSYISKAVANQIANTLPRTPIVAFYNEELGDYEDHGEEIIINNKGIKFIKKTVPFGAVSEKEPIGWKSYLDRDGVTREYLVARGFLWTGRYPHLSSVIADSKGQSMEFFPESVQGDWAKFDNEPNEIFIFSEAVVSALCILGDEVEPAFEGASVYGVNSSEPAFSYSLDKNEFKNEFNTFMFELNKVLEEGSEKMENEKEVILEDEVIQTELEKTDDILEGQEKVEETLVEVVETEVDKTDIVVETEEITEDLVIVEEAVADVVVVDETPTAVEFSLEDFNSLKSELETLKTDFEVLTENYNALVAEKNQLINAEKDAVIDRFSSILGDDVEAVKNAKDNYSVEEIEDKLSAIAFKKGVSFSLVEDTENIMVSKLSHATDENVPAWLKAVDKRNK